jgi:hypothetical protein
MQLGPDLVGLTSTPPLEFDGVPALSEGYDLDKSLAVGPYHTCALANDGEVHCFGANFYSSMGVSNQSPPPAYVNVALPKRAVAVYASYYATCAQLEDDELWCWGGYIHDRPDYWFADPVPKYVLTGPLETLATKNDTHFAVFLDGSVKSWGNNSSALRRDAADPWKPTPCCEDL